MAQKKGLIYRLTMGKDNQPDFTTDKLPGSRWAVFKDVFRNRLGALVKINLLVLLFCLPAIAWVVIVTMMKSVDGTIIPYSGNIGFGIPVVQNAALIGQQRSFQFDMQMYVILIPLIMIASIGLSGAFYVMKRLAWGEGISVTSHFFRGIKMNFLPFLWSSLFCGVSLALLMFNMGVYDVIVVNKVWKVIGMAVSILQFVLLMCMMIFLTTQAVTYKLGVWGLIKNSFLFAIALLPQNLFFLLLSALPVLLLMILPSFISMFGYLIFAILGFSYIILIWTVYAHYAFDKFINDRIEGAVKDKGIYRKNPQDEKEKAERARKTNNIRFNNPKKKKKVSSIDEGSSFAPLPTNFSRADLAKLQEEKEAVKREIDAEYEAPEDDEDETEDFYEESGYDAEVEAEETEEQSDVSEEEAEADIADESSEERPADEPQKPKTNKLAKYKKK